MKKSQLTAGIIAFLMSATTSHAATIQVAAGDNLQTVINSAAAGDTLIIAADSFTAQRTLFTEPLCGNCLDPQTEVQASYGVIVKGKSLVLIGQDREASILVTNAGYGLYFEDSPNSTVMNLTITGGKRDSDGNATNAGIVVRRSRVHITHVDIRDNSHRDTTTVGIGGVFGREGAEIIIDNCNIVGNGWDGVALYRGAVARVTDCLIKDGRGAGIGVTWDATCTAYRNEITGYWKGIGAFGTSWLIAHNNLVHDNLGWGMIATGEAYMDMTNNVVYHNGNCGVAPWSTESRGRIVNNIIAANGWREQWVCPQVGVWNYGNWSQWEFAHNIVWSNDSGEYRDIWDQTDVNGNLSMDPMFVGEGDFHLQDGSPARHAGDSAIYNPDGTVSHIGCYGGPQTRPDSP